MPLRILLCFRYPPMELCAAKQDRTPPVESDLGRLKLNTPAVHSTLDHIFSLQ